MGDTFSSNPGHLMNYPLPLASSVLVASLLFASPASSVGGEESDGTAASTLAVSFELYAGGIPLGHVAMSARVEGSDYKAISTLETGGVAKTIWKSKIETSSSGKLDRGHVQPVLYDSYSQNQGDPRRQVTLTFGPDGPNVAANPPYPDNKYPISGELKRNTLDPLSAGLFLVTALSADGEKPCGVVAPIFDGRRRYDIALNYLKSTNIRMDNGLYTGPAQVCQVHFKQIAGYSQTVIENNKNFPKIYAWVVPVKSTANPDHHYVVPVRVWAETEYGVIAAVASEWKLDGMAVRAK